MSHTFSPGCVKTLFSAHTFIINYSSMEDSAMPKRTDLAAEAHELWRERAGDTSLPGADIRDDTVCGFPVSTVRILDARGTEALGKPPGTYITLTLSDLVRRENDSFPRACKALSQLLQPLTGSGHGCVLIAALGNAAITPDALGPLCARSICVTRHMIRHFGDSFAHLRPVACVTPGVLGTTGMESLELVRGAVTHTRPDCVIVVAALASRRMGRVCTNVQIADTGLTPGSGVGNHRAGFNEDTLGVPVIALGVPTVVDAATLALDLLEESGYTGVDADTLAAHSDGMIVTPREIDTRVSEMARVLGYGINLALQPEWDIADVELYLS